MFIEKEGVYRLCISPLSRCCGDTTRTYDLQVMSLASYQLLHSAMFNPCIFFLKCGCKDTILYWNSQTFPIFIFGCIEPHKFH